ncbi:Uncharacterized protein At5g08430 [Linum perenne]
MRKLVFNGWGSKELLEFLASIGKDTAMQLSQQQVLDIITTYCVNHSLFDPEKKKKILCDAKLQTLFRRKSINKKVLNAHLMKHFSDNQSDDESGLQAEIHQWLEADARNDETDVVPPGKRLRDSRSEVDSQKAEMVARKPWFALVTAENIKCVYLRRNVLNELLKDPESFDAKVIGSFVRIRADPYDYGRRNSHILVLVTGVNRSLVNVELRDSIRLQVCRVLEDVPICKVSDDKFTEEECEDLRQQVKDGLIQRPVFANFQEKARSLHEVITKDVFDRERAGIAKTPCRSSKREGMEKRISFDHLLCTLSEYLERLSKLKTPEEQSRLIREIPEIIGDEEQSGCMQVWKPDELEKKVAGNEVQVTIASGNWDNLEKKNIQPGKQKDDDDDHGEETKRNEKIEVIDLGVGNDDDEAIDKDSKIWRCASTNGMILGGLYSISLLKQWKDSSSAGPCVLQFKVWKEGQSLDEAILLDDAIRQVYHPN